MSSDSDTIRKLVERSIPPALADTLLEFSPRATISRQALELATGQTVPSVDDSAMIWSTADLPRLSVDLRLSRDNEALPVQTSADLKVLGVIGEGGMGRVLLARQRSLGRDIAIKTLKSADDAPDLASGLLREARITGALEHPGIVPIYALGLDEDNVPVMVMKRIEGISFQTLLDHPEHTIWKNLLSNTPDRLEACLQILMRVGEALAFAHDRGVLHRDVKPENIMVGAYGEVYLCDWGVAARLNETRANESLVGTPAFMAPEMLTGEAVTVQTDVYLLGATLHCVLTGQGRHRGASMSLVLQSIMDSRAYVYDETVPTELADLCNRATSTNVEVRPASVDAFRKELAEYLRRRNALELCQAANERLKTLETVLEALPEDGVPEDLQGLYRQATEARFGFSQGLRIDARLEVAQDGFRRTLAALAEIELRQQHIESAEALMNEMVRPTERLIQFLAVAKKRAHEAHQERERLRAMARDLDPSVGVRPRLLGISLISGAALMAIVITLGSSDVKNVSHKEVTLFAAFMALTTVGIFGLLRKRLLATLLNRRIAALAVTSTMLMLTDRLLGWKDGRSIPAIMATNTYLLGSMFAIASVTLERRLVWVAAPLFAARLVMLFRPDDALMLFTYASVIVSFIFIWIWVAPMQRAAKEKSA